MFLNTLNINVCLVVRLGSVILVNCSVQRFHIYICVSMQPHNNPMCQVIMMFFFFQHRIAYKWVQII